jgi:hypothetical protein
LERARTASSVSQGGIDELDKSVWVGEAPRRSTSSLETKHFAVAQMSPKKITILGRCVAILAAIAWVCFFELYIYLEYTRPHAVDVAAGRIYALSNHGSIAYLTRSEYWFLYSLEYVAIGLFIVAAIFQYKLRRANHRAR